MAIQHASIADADRHENKHAAGATNGHVLKANGDATTSFVAPNTLANVSISSTVESASITNQGPTGTDAPYQVTWGDGSSNSDANIASNGLVTITTAGLYMVTAHLNLGRTGVTGVATLVARLSVNGVPIETPKGVRIDTSANIATVTFAFLRRFNAADILKAEVIRDSAGNNDGGLITIDPVLAGWDNVPSAYIRLQKIAGGY